MNTQSITLFLATACLALWQTPQLLGDEPQLSPRTGPRRSSAPLFAQASAEPSEATSTPTNAQPPGLSLERLPDGRPLRSNAAGSPDKGRPRPCVYRAPRFSTHRVRVVSISRSQDSVMPGVQVLAPDHPGLTIQAHPDLYYRLAETANRLEITLIIPGRAQPVLEFTSPGPVESGIHRIDLAAFEVALPLDTECEWYVAVVRDPDRRARDLISRGVIKRVRPDSSLQSVVEAADAWEVPAAYADAGLWYDAYSSLAQLERQHPGNPAIREELQRLLAQVDLVGLPPD